MKWFASLLCVSVLVGCAHGKMGTVDMALSKGAISKKTPIFIEPIDAKTMHVSGDKAADTVRISQERTEIESRYHRMIGDALKKRGYDAHSTTGRKDSGIVLFGKITRFEHGSGAARALVGMGAGSSNLFTDLVLEDRSKKQVLARFEVIGTSGGRGGLGATGGFLKAHLEDGSEQTAKYIDENK